MHSPLLLLALLVGLAQGLVSTAAEYDLAPAPAAAAAPVAAASGPPAAAAPVKKLREKAQDVGSVYTHNAACLPNYCINPVIPGLMFMDESMLEKNKKIHWTCARIDNTKSLFKLGGFCSRIIAAYPFMMPTPAAGSKITEGDSVQMQSEQALNAYVGHLSAMGFDFWDHTTPWNGDNECIRSVWKMSCYTHFPRCNEINPGRYLAPCASECQGYLKKCQVECCDEGVQCVFQHQKQFSNGTMVTEHGYPDHKGPSPLCTGGAHSLSAVAAVFLAILALFHH